MKQATLYPDWRQVITYSSDGPQPQVLMDDRAKIIMVGLEPGQKIPAHAEAAAMYHFLAGNGWMLADGDRMAVAPGATIVMPEGTVRGLEAETRLAFLAVRITST